ncbi:hypothetical protein [Amycolatopsis nalaikhensis]|uniref:Small secreted hydrophilic protein n=1 Tax=Amycolatopsis nalaikhensis TaxID=715472 RepID=A0ABY8XU79_9PSEU|nr:hypothetical protein [Amycolatopsis sp. 2-2]WIV59189.1 hypothetical protein QP939_11440 [Amycolatopsis sp. 2-2]
MRRRTRIAAVVGGAAALLAATLGTAAATAAPSPSAPASVPAPAAGVQEGDQAAPDRPGAPETEKAGEATGVEQEPATEADGPGGHQDPAGNVDHQFQGEE